MRNQLRPKHLIFLLNMAFLTHSTRIIIIFIVLAPQSDRDHQFPIDFFSGRTVCIMGRGLSWSVADMQLLGDGHTPVSSREGGMDLLGAQRAQTKYYTKQESETSRNVSEKCPRRASSKYNIGS